MPDIETPVARIVTLVAGRPLRLAAALFVSLMLGMSVKAQTQPADRARCSDQDLEVLRRAWKIGPDVTVYDAVCKAWPDDARLRLTALVYDKGDGAAMGPSVAPGLPKPLTDPSGGSERSERGGPRSGWLALALVNAKTQRIVSRGREGLEEDAMLRFDEGLVTLDTARYRLAPGLRAFGVALRLENRARCVDGGIDGQWRLFVPEGAAIRAVTNEGELHLHMWRFAEGSQCDGRAVTEAGLTFDMKPHAGTWADLVITARRSDRKRPVVVVVPYDGRGYRLGRLIEGGWPWYP
jgi:hypothetical protein